MKFTTYFCENKEILDNLLEDYFPFINSMKRKMKSDDTAKKLVGFDRRLRISYGMSIKFSSDNSGITREDTKSCYVMMLKISDLWFAFEYLSKVSGKLIPYEQLDKNGNPVSSVPLGNNSKINFYYENTFLDRLGFRSTILQFNNILTTHFLSTDRKRAEIKKILSFLHSITKDPTKKLIEESINLIKNQDKLETKHVLSIIYGIRNVYAHDGVAAAFGTQTDNYDIKKDFYFALYDCLVLLCIAFGKICCDTYIFSDRE